MSLLLFDDYMNKFTTDTNVFILALKCINYIYKKERITEEEETVNHVFL